MGRVEQIGDATLYHGDALEFFTSIPGLVLLPKIDAVVTDPPYGVEGGAGHDAETFGKANYECEWIDDPAYIRRVCVPVINACRKLASCVVVTCGARCMMQYPQPDDIGCFWTPASARRGRFGFATFSPILYYGRDWRAGKGALPSGKVLTEAAEKNGHPCPKPIAAWTWLLDKAAPPTAAILDPFMGSGTTGVACANLGRKFIGIEIEKKYFDIACERIDNAYRQVRLFA